mgnify:CR=1 FL=1
MQLNLQQARSDTSNLTQIILEKNIDIAVIQEPYTVSHNVTGFPKSFRIFSHGNGRKRSAIITANKNIDSILISQLSDEDCVVVEFTHKNLNFLGASIYCDIDFDVENITKKVEKVIRAARGKGLILSMDTNARSRTWYDVITNERRKIRKFHNNQRSANYERG